MEKEKRNKFRHPSYTGMFILILAVVLLFGFDLPPKYGPGAMLVNQSL